MYLWKLLHSRLPESLSNYTRPQKLLLPSYGMPLIGRNKTCLRVCSGEGFQATSKARLSKHLKQTTRGCPNNGHCLSVGTDKLSINVPEQWGFGPALPLVCWVTLYFYFLWAPLPCCNLFSHEREEFTARDLPTRWSLSPARHSRNRQRRQGQSRSEQEPKKITKSHAAYSLIPAPHVLYLSLAGLFLVKKRTQQWFYTVLLAKK